MEGETVNDKLKKFYETKAKTYHENDKKLYESLEKKSEYLRKFKFSALAALILTVIVKEFYSKIPFENFDNIIIITFWGNKFILSLIGFILSSLIAYLLHRDSYKRIIKAVQSIQDEDERNKTKHSLNKDTTSNKKRLLLILKSSLLWLFSPDYFYALSFKNKICDEHKHIKCSNNTCPSDCYVDTDGICLLAWDTIKIKMKYFVIFSNWNNVILSSIIAIITVLSWGYNNGITDLLFSIIIFRVISRFLEISIAFFKDVVRVDDKLFIREDDQDTIYIHRWKNTFLLKSGRISLAIHSIVEVIILFSLIYYFIYNTAGDQKDIKTMIGNNNDLNFINFFLLSASVSFLNFSYTSFCNIFWSVAHVSQVILSLVLISLSIASYIGLDSNLLERDLQFFEDLAKEKLKQQNQSDSST
jgi:hypothetical protein